MDRKKKLETSLEGLFSRPKGEEEKVPEANKPAPEKPQNKSASGVEKKEKPAPTPSPKKESPAAGVKAESPAQVAVNNEKTVVAEEKGNQPSVKAEKPEYKKTDPIMEKQAPNMEKNEYQTPPPAVEKGNPQPVTVETALTTVGDKELLALEEEEIQLLVFEINRVNYAIEVSMVQTIIKPQPVYLIPGTPDYLKGLTNLRGDVVPVIDLRTRFDLPEQEIQKDTRFMVIRVNEILASLIVDKVNGVKTVPLSLIEKPSGVVMDINNRYLTGMARFDGQIILILDLIQTIDPKTA